MKIKDYKHLIIFISVFFITAAAYAWFIKTPYFESFIIWSKDHNTLLFVILVLIKIVGIVWPPLPGGYFTLAAIPAIGWGSAYLADFTGSAIGSVMAYYIGKRYGYNFLNKIFDSKTLNKIKKLKVKKHRELEVMFTLRILGGGTLTEAVCYGAGLLNVSFKNFIVGILVSHIVFGVPGFYFAEAIFKTKNLFLSYLLILLAIPLFLKLKNRYFE